ncbi:hypothetical protein DPMN_084667 [Dreissena polymorpha]|uniref:Uncharacterized protein n=1 Tax=Dreissena polymorpha TaxID=45954 RepID=A0A9D4BL35_DREPO|nr:hypothetical protein DPMN_084667 [Dreissena polymorpha]
MATYVKDRASRIEIHNSHLTSVPGQQLERARSDRGESRPQKIFSPLSLSPSSRTASSLLRLLSSPRCSGLVNRCLSSRARYPDLPEVPSEEGREQWDSGLTSGETIRGGPGAGPLIAYVCSPKNIEGVAL